MGSSEPLTKTVAIWKAFPFLQVFSSRRHTDGFFQNNSHSRGPKPSAWRGSAEKALRVAGWVGTLCSEGHLPLLKGVSPTRLRPIPATWNVFPGLLSPFAIFSREVENLDVYVKFLSF